MTIPPAPAPDPRSVTSAEAAPRLAHDRGGRGEPLVLLHGQGLSRRCWDPVVEILAAHRDVITVDLPGHGESARQPKDRGSAPEDLAVAVGELLDELGLPTAHVAGNSSGGWIALELGRLRRARTVTALDPAGLWRKSAPRHIRVTMRQVRLAAKLTRRVAPDAPRTRLARGLSFLQASGRPFRLPYEPVRTAVHDMAAAPGFRETLRALEKRQFEDGAAITVPVTVAFGSRDRVLLPGVARRAPRPDPLGEPAPLRPRPDVRRPRDDGRTPAPRERSRIGLDAGRTRQVAAQPGGARWVGPGFVARRAGRRAAVQASPRQVLDRTTPAWGIRSRSRRAYASARSRIPAGLLPTFGAALMIASRTASRACSLTLWSAMRGDGTSPESGPPARPTTAPARGAGAGPS